MMYNWMVSALATGASIVLYEGSPFLPKDTVMWDLVDEIGITILGTSAKWLAAVEQKGLKPRETHELKSLHTILSTGSPLKPQSYRFVYQHVKSDLLLGSISGGSDIISCFVGQNPTIPVYEGEVQSVNLGMAIECWDENGKPVEGAKGELVCTRPFPCQPVFFWNDPEGEKYKKAYFSHFKKVWSHGDFITINPGTGGIVMLGRSDGTLNPNGIRFGSAEIYNVVEALEPGVILDSLCVSQYSSSGEERVILFLKMAEGQDMTPQVVDMVKTAIRSQLSARHVPALILQTRDIPYTVNGKKVEVAVKKIISGKSVGEEGSSLLNPESLSLFKNLPSLEGF
jgi:acetoacetyl-CoA synthetase